MKPILAVLVVVAGLAAGGEARAQMFGERTLGRPRPPRPRLSQSRSQDARSGRSENPGTENGNVGTVMGNERFFRGNRSAVNFVGRDSQDVRGFVGVQQVQEQDAGSPAEGAISDLLIEPLPDVNLQQELLAPLATSMYRPRLQIAFDFPRPPAEAVSWDLTRRLAASTAIHLTTPIEVVLEGETATLRGEVASERDRTLARLLLLFEPGISNVRNELTVAAASQTPAETRPTLPPRQGSPETGD